MSLDAFPRADTHKWLLCGDSDGRLHVFAADAGLDQHRDILAEASRQSGRSLQPVGGGLGGAAFPGISQEFGGVGAHIVELLRSRPATAVPVPDWVAAVLRPYIHSPADDAEAIARRVRESADWRIEACVQPGGGLWVQWYEGGAIEGQRECDLSAEDVRDLD